MPVPGLAFWEGVAGGSHIQGQHGLWSKLKVIADNLVIPDHKVKSRKRAGDIVRGRAPPWHRQGPEFIFLICHTNNTQKKRCTYYVILKRIKDHLIL